MIIRILLAVIVGVIVMSLLDYFGILTHTINALLGVLAAILTFYSSPNLRV